MNHAESRYEFLVRGELLSPRGSSCANDRAEGEGCGKGFEEKERPALTPPSPKEKWQISDQLRVFLRTRFEIVFLFSRLRRMILDRPRFGIPVCGESFVQPVWCDGTADRLDRTPVEFGTRTDLDEVREKTVEITAIPAVQTLYGTQIPQVPPFEHDILRPVDDRHPVQGKRNLIIERHEHVHNDSRKEDPVDERDRQTVPDESYNSIFL